MLPSSTVENYLKVIFQQQIRLPGDSLVPMGHIASAVGVTPGTATTMVKTLADSGLLHYEPYNGVRLTGAGERLAGLVIRRHRLVELFLVQVMGMSWDEVHDEAEQLEHVVSERLIERMDEMLGRPQVDPHGDPIPTSDGWLEHRDLHNLLTCPLGVPVTVTRVADQDAAFLRFLEGSSLKPGQQLSVESRDAAADSVQVRNEGGTLTIGARAASKLLVEVALILLMLLGTPLDGAAQASIAPAALEPFAITDNSFFVEEAFNQEAGIFQNIAVGIWDGEGGWALQFTQEWPAGSIDHQLSYAVSAVNSGSDTGAGDVFLNYRYQLSKEGPGRPAVSPRISAIVPVGDETRGLGQGAWGWQANLPVSKQFGDVYLHGNAGVTWLPSATTSVSIGEPVANDVSLTSPFLAGSVNYRVAPMFILMLEGVVDWQQQIAPAGTRVRERVTILAPGARGGWNVGDKQIVVGAAIPVTRVAGGSSAGVLGYFSYELPFQ